ncbi:MAG: chemotaxis protein CheW [candidate division Zixibacteria bacterium]|nr:chemotaxis protein CheW [candidate division Zixibacteria bacterium]
MGKETDKSFDELIQLVSFKLGQEEFGVDIIKVQEINRMVPITKVPQAPHYCEGIINLRGKVIPVIDLRKKFEMSVEEWTKNTRIIVVDINNSVTGMIVDAVDEVLRIPRSTIEPAPPVISSVNSDYINGVAKLEESLLIFLNIGRIAGEAREEIGEVEELLA